MGEGIRTAMSECGNEVSSLLTVGVGVGVAGNVVGLFRLIVVPFS